MNFELKGHEMEVIVLNDEPWFNFFDVGEALGMSIQEIEDVLESVDSRYERVIRNE
jgi:prophage antirepressor-like protein